MARPDEILRACADTFEQRSAVYGDNYKRFGALMAALFPDGIVPRFPSEDEWNRFGIVVQIVSKLTRYCEQFPSGGHKDSAHDMAVYAAMLEELTK